jgi:Ca2+-binding RTX toxin-like protein
MSNAPKTGLARIITVLVMLVTAVILGIASTGYAEPIEEACPAPPSEKHIILSDEPIINGTARGDYICAGRSTNVIIGGLLDDYIYGGGGDDIIIGGHGADTIDGGGGNDWMRGGDGPDCYEGGFETERITYTDTVSFADMTPNEGASTAGVIVDLSARDETIGGIAPACGGVSGPGRALGEGYNEELNHIDNVVGSAFDDDITAPASAETHLEGGLGDDVLRGTGGNDSLRGEDGADTCTNDGAAVECADGTGTHRPAEAFVYAESRETRDYGLILMGAEGSHADNLEVRRSEAALVASASEALGVLGPSCSASEAHAASCSLSRARYVVVWGDDGDDTLSVGRELTNGPGSIDLNGGPGSDTLTASSGEELLFSGLGGNDRLTANEGEDALISEGDPREGAAFGTGGDILDAGSGDDQIVTDNACAGHTFQGGTGTDVIGFARQTTIGGVASGVTAVLGERERNGVAVAVRDTGGSFEGCTESTMVPGAETLEGTNHNDYLQGNEGPNTIWGRKGNDLLIEIGGADILRGHDGNDEIWDSGAGSGDITGGEGNDGIYADGSNNAIDGQGGNDDLRGGSGRDTINGGSGIDRLQGFGGDDVLRGGDDSDTIIGYEGFDELFGEGGSDSLYARDGVADRAVNCGEGSDIPVEADRADPVDRSCERR